MCKQIIKINVKCFSYITTFFSIFIIDDTVRRTTQHRDSPLISTLGAITYTTSNRHAIQTSSYIHLYKNLYLFFSLFFLFSNDDYLMPR